MENDDLTDWLIDREECIFSPEEIKLNHVIEELTDWINGEDYDTEDMKDNIIFLIDYMKGML